MVCILFTCYASINSTNAQDNFSCTNNLYQVVNGKELKKLNPLKGTYETIGTSVIGYNGAGLNIEDGYIYGISGNNLVKINNLGKGTNLGAISNFSALSYSGDFNTSGNWYSFKKSGSNFIMNTIDVSETNTIVAIENTITVLTGVGTPANCADISYNVLTGKFYGMNSGYINEFDPINKTVKVIGNYYNVADPGAYGAVWADNMGNVYFFNNDTGNIYRASFNIDGSISSFSFISTSEPNGSNDGIGCSSAPAPSFPEVCNNGIDDDNDGLTDCEDPDCTESSDCKINGNIVSSTKGTNNSLVTYQVFLTNITSKKQSFTATDKLPEGFRFVQDTIDFDAKGFTDFKLQPVENNTNTISWGNITLEVNETVRIAYDVLIDPTVVAGNYTNNFSLSENLLLENSLQSTIEVVTNYTPKAYECEPAFYQVYKKRGRNEPNMYGKLNPITGDYNPIAVASDYANGLGFDINTGFVYGASGKKFIQLDADGTVIYKGIDFNKNVYRGDVDNNGKWYGVDGDDMVIIDLNMLSIIARHENQGLKGWDIAYNTDGHFYATSNGKLHKYDTTTNTKSTVGNLIGNDIPTTGYGAQWTGSDGYLYASNNSTGKIIRIDVTTLEARVVSYSIDGLSKNDGFSCPTTIPAIYGYEYGDNSNVPEVKILTYQQDLNTDNIPENNLVWLGNTCTYDANNPANDLADGDLDDGVNVTNEITNGQITVTMGLNSNFSATAYYLIGLDWDNNGTFDTIINKSTAIYGAKTSVENITAPSNFTYGNVNIRVIVSEDALTNNNITGEILALGEVEDYVYTIAIPEICDNGIDDNGNGLIDCDDPSCTSAKNHCTYTTTSGGNDGGLESNSRLAEKIAQRNYTRSKKNASNLKFNTTSRNFKNYKKNYTSNAKNSYDLVNLIPQDGIPNTEAFLSTPNDLIAITNATETLSVDYFNKDARRGSILSTKSENGVYEHTKVICDRVIGTSILNMWHVAMYKTQKLIVTKQQNKDGNIEYSCSFSFFEDDSGAVQIESHWNLSNYTHNPKYYNFQVWADNTSNLRAVVKKIIRNIIHTSKASVNFKVTQLPEVFVKNASYNNHKLTLNLVNLSGAKELAIKGNYLSTETAQENTFENKYLLSGTKEETLVLDTDGIYALGITLNESEHTVSDAIYFADGVWGLDVDETIEEVTSFDIYADVQSKNPEDLYIERGILLKGKLKNKIAIYRSLKSNFEGTDISNYKAFRLESKGIKGQELEIIFVDNTIEDWENQVKTNITLSEENNENYVDFSSITTNKNQLKNIFMIVFILQNNEQESKAISLELNRLSFTSVLPELNNSITPETETTIGICPNPVQTTSIIRFKNTKSSKYEFYIYNSNGQTIAKKEDKIATGLHEIIIDRKNNPSGVYIYELVLNKEDNKKGKILFR